MTVSNEAGETFRQTTHPDAQWFPKAGFGLFMHWGIHSVAGIQPSWAMIKNYGGDNADNSFHPPEKYYALANQFNPQDYNPDKWMAAAKSAGFTYAVLTTKHHDGYTLWPSRHGIYGTRTHMNGRDLLEPYVKACRKFGLKLGFYFSPRDWSYPGFPIADVDFDYKKRDQHKLPSPGINRRNFEKFYSYTRGQMEELLTRYGKIDILWFDGVCWPGIEDPHTLETLRWVRSLQPGIVMNNRWDDKTGDFSTPECRLPKGRPEGWWEACAIWNGHWGYNPGRPFVPNAWVLENLVNCRMWGGNFLLNCGPSPEGTMPDGFYERCAELSQWMAHSGESLIGAEPLPDASISNVPATRRGKRCYLHILAGHKGPAILRDVPRPARASLLYSGKEIAIHWHGKSLEVSVPERKRSGLDDVIAIDC